MLIGVTGQIGSGKTATARILQSFGAEIVDADLIGRRVVERSALLRKKLAGEFGADVLTPKGNLRRKVMAQRAFADPKSKHRFNALVHPHLLRELRSQVGAALKRSAVVVVDAALLLDWNYDREVDFVLVIHASRGERLRRLEARGISRDDALARQRAQLPYREYQRRADKVILNNGSLESLRNKLNRLWHTTFVKAVDSHHNIR